MLGSLKQPCLRSTRARGLAENVQGLPSTASVARVRLPACNICIDNVPGKKASVSIYTYLAAKHNGEQACISTSGIIVLSTACQSILNSHQLGQIENSKKEHKSNVAQIALPKAVLHQCSRLFVPSAHNCRHACGSLIECLTYSLRSKY